MPHKCTECGKVHEDGSENIVKKGCDNCGNGTFSLVKRKEDGANKERTPEEEESTDRKDATIADPDDERWEEATSTTSLEVEEDIEEVKEALSTQFESIRVLDRGKFQINLTQIGKDEDQIVSVREDGKYCINIAETGKSPDEDDGD